MKFIPTLAITALLMNMTTESVQALSIRQMSMKGCCPTDECKPSCGCCGAGSGAKSESEKVEKVVDDLKKDQEMKKVNEETAKKVEKAVAETKKTVEDIENKKVITEAAKKSEEVAIKSAEKVEKAVNDAKAVEPVKEAVK